MEIYEDEQCQELLGEANVIGASSFTRERININRAMIKRYIRSVAMRKGPTLPWFIPDPVARQYGISTTLPQGITPDMKPLVDADGNFIVKQVLPNGNAFMTAAKPGEQMQIHEFFGGGNAQPEADPLPQFNFPCDDAQVPVELIDPELKYPDLKPVDQFIKDSKLLTRSLEIWSFLQTFSEQLALSPFSYDDWEEAICCTDPAITKNPLLEETMLALLSTLMKDRRNLTKGAYSERIKQLVSSFPIPALNANEADNSSANEISYASSASESSASLKEPEIVIYSDEGSDSDDNVPFYKRTRQSSITTSKVLLPAIDLRKHRWYETKAMDQWHFVLVSSFLEMIEMLEAEIEAEELKVQEAEEEEAEKQNEEQTSEETGDEVYVDSCHEMDIDDDVKESKPTNPNEDSQASPQTAQQNPKIQESERLISTMLAFKDAYSPIIDELLDEGSRHLFTRFLDLSLSHKFALLEFLIHVHYDREAFTAYVEDCLERQPELRRQKREVEYEFQELEKAVEELESRVAVLKAENAEIVDRLAEDDEIELSSEDESENESESEESEEKKAAPPTEPLTAKGRAELAEKRAANRKEINSLNANLRRVRPEYTGLKRKLDHFSTDLRQASSFRVTPLGEDRNGRVYWWFGDFARPMSRILVESAAEQRWLGAIDSEAGFDQLMAWLNALGIREAKLKSNLMDVEADLRRFLEERDDPNAVVEPAEEADEEEVVSKGKRGRGRPKGSVGRRNTDRPFQKYRNNM